MMRRATTHSVGELGTVASSLNYGDCRVLPLCETGGDGETSNSTAGGRREDGRRIRAEGVCDRGQGACGFEGGGRRGGTSDNQIRSGRRSPEERQERESSSRNRASQLAVQEECRGPAGRERTQQQRNQTSCRPSPPPSSSTSAHPACRRLRSSKPTKADFVQRGDQGSSRKQQQSRRSESRVLSWASAARNGELKDAQKREGSQEEGD